jgi:predicted transcriptional regulator
LFKIHEMNSENLKRRIFQRVDSLDQKGLEEIYGLISNHLNGENEHNDWEQLSFEEKQGIDAAIGAINQGQFLSHDDVMTKIRKKYA